LIQALTDRPAKGLSGTNRTKESAQKAKQSTDPAAEVSILPQYRSLLAPAAGSSDKNKKASE
jgi:hypothetical protein